MMSLFCRWLRTFFDVDESRLRFKFYLHEGLNLADATAFWSDVTGIPRGQFTRPYRRRGQYTPAQQAHDGLCNGDLRVRTHAPRGDGLVRALLDADP